MAFHRQHVESTAGEDQRHHMEMARRCAGDAERITRAILASGVTIENQAAAMRRRDLDAAQKIIQRHSIMHGIGIPVDDLAPARMAMASDIADALAAERGELPAV
jgi:hypothetical protein